jgi:hypothetical protein
MDGWLPSIQSFHTLPLPTRTFGTVPCSPNLREYAFSILI